MASMYYIGLDVHKKTISYCVKDAGGHVQAEGTIRRRASIWTAGWQYFRSHGPQPWKRRSSRVGFTTI